MLSVTVYTTGSSCMRCTMTCRCLQSAGIPFRVIEVTAEPAALEFVTEELGYTEAPVVVVDDDPQHHWSGFRPDLISRLASRVGTGPVVPLGPSTSHGIA